MPGMTPYYAVIFTSTRTEGDNGYTKMASQMEDLAKQQPGYLGIESARGDVGITVSYWQSLESISNWKANTDHLFAQQKGKTDWYKWYKVRICSVEREYVFDSNNIIKRFTQGFLKKHSEKLPLTGNP